MPLRGGFSNWPVLNHILSLQLFVGPSSNADIAVVNDRLSSGTDKETGEQSHVTLQSVFWSCLVAGLLNKWYLPELCPSALQFSWPVVFNRLITVYSFIDSGYELHPLTLSIPRVPSVKLRNFPKVQTHSTTQSTVLLQSFLSNGHT